VRRLKNISIIKVTVSRNFGIMVKSVWVNLAQAHDIKEENKDFIMHSKKLPVLRVFSGSSGRA